MRKRLLLWFLILNVIAVLLSACGSKDSFSSTAYTGSSSIAVNKASAAEGPNENGIAGYTPAQDSKSDTADSATANQKENFNIPLSQSQRQNTNVTQKIVFTGQINFETLSFEKTTAQLCQYISSVGGYQQKSSVNGGKIGYDTLKSAEYVFRIPKTKYMQAFTDLKKFGTVVFEQSNGEDVSDQYFDTESRIKSLRIRQERLEALLEKADKMSDILSIEKDLQDTIYSIESYTGKLKKWDSLVEYSTLTVNVNEVEEIKPQEKTDNRMGSRIVRGFMDSVSGLWAFIQDVIVFLAAALPVIIPLGLVGYFLYILYKKKIKKKDECGDKIESENNNLPTDDHLNK